MDSTAGDDDSMSDETATGDEVNSQSDEDHSDQQTADTDDSYTPQPDALRRQQFFLAVGGALLGGAAVIISLIQQYPAYRLLWIPTGGIASILLFRLIAGSIFPGGSEHSDEATGADEDEKHESDSAESLDKESPDSDTSTE